MCLGDSLWSVGRWGAFEAALWCFFWWTACRLLLEDPGEVFLEVRVAEMSVRESARCLSERATCLRDVCVCAFRCLLCDRSSPSGLVMDV